MARRRKMVVSAKNLSGIKRLKGNNETYYVT
jgi:hypothetical protein